MKTLCLIRHAKSSWENISLSDYERPLNKRGERDAPLLGKVLSKIISTPDIIYSSPAKRAITTAHIIAGKLSYDKTQIIENEKIYDSSISDIMKIIYTTPDKFNSIMMFGHNPTFTMLSNYLSDKSIDNLPTCGFVQIDFKLEKWKELEGNTGKLVLYEYPKKYLK